MSFIKARNKRTKSLGVGVVKSFGRREGGGGKVAMVGKIQKERYEDWYRMKSLSKRYKQPGIKF